MAKTTKSNRTGTATIDDQKLDRGEGGELHQTASGKIAVLTTAQGGPVSDDQNSLKIGPRGPTLIEDFHFRRRSSTSTMNAFLSGSCMRADMRHTASSKTTSRYRSTPGPTYSSALAKRRLLSSDFLPSPEARARSI